MNRHRFPPSTSGLECSISIGDPLGLLWFPFRRGDINIIGSGFLIVFAFRPDYLGPAMWTIPVSKAQANTVRAAGPTCSGVQHAKHGPPARA